MLRICAVSMQNAFWKVQNIWPGENDVHIYIFMDEERAECLTFK